MHTLSFAVLFSGLLLTVSGATPEAPAATPTQVQLPPAAPDDPLQNPAALAKAAAAAPERIAAIQAALKAGIKKQKLDEEASYAYIEQQKTVNQAQMAHRAIYGRLRNLQSDTNSLWSSVDTNNCLKKIVERIAKEIKERSYDSRKAKRRNNIDDLISKYNNKANEYNAASYSSGTRGQDCKCRKCSLPEKIKAAEAECKTAQETLQAAQDELAAQEEKFTTSCQAELAAQKEILNRHRLLQEKLAATEKAPATKE